MSEQKYIYWHPGEEQPNDLNGWMWYSSTPKEYKNRDDPEGSPLHERQHYRKAVSNAEYRAHHGMKLWHSLYSDSKIQDGYMVIDFRRNAKGELFAHCDGSAGKTDGLMISFVPILEKIEPEIEWVTPTQADVINSIKTTGDYPEAVFAVNRDELSDANAYIGKLVYVGDHFVDVDCCCFSHCKMDASLREEWQ